MVDPIEELVATLERGDGPDGAWVLRWSEGGREPFAAAWGASHDLVAMAQLLEVLELAAWLGASASQLAHAQAAIPDGWSFGDSDALRRALRDAPPLARVVASWQLVAQHRHGSMRPGTADARAPSRYAPVTEPAPPPFPRGR